MIYKVVLKGLIFGAELWQTHTAFFDSTPEEIDSVITAHIYEWRQDAGYYKVKYISKEIIPCDNL